MVKAAQTSCVYLSQETLSVSSDNTLEYGHQPLCSTASVGCSWLEVEKQDEVCVLKRVTTWPRGARQHCLFKHSRDCPLLGTTAWMQNSCSRLRSWFQGLLPCSMKRQAQNESDMVPGQFSQNSHTSSSTQKTSARVATSSGEDFRPFKCLSSGLNSFLSSYSLK